MVNQGKNYRKFSFHKKIKYQYCPVGSSKWFVMINLRSLAAFEEELEMLDEEEEEEEEDLGRK